MNTPFDSHQAPNQKPLALKKAHFSRRALLGSFGAAGAVAGLGVAFDGEALGQKYVGVGSLDLQQRQKKAFELRRDAAQFHREQSLPLALTNGDVQLPGHIGSFSKALPHNSLGEVDANAYSALLYALSTGNSQDFEAIPMGGPGKLSNPQSSYSWAMEGPDGHQVDLAAPPSLSSAAAAGEMV